MGKGKGRGQFQRNTLGGGGQAGMMQQLQQLQQQLAEAQEKLAEETVTVTAGGGAISITMTGDQKCTDVKIAPEFLEDMDAEMLQDMLLSAVNMALDKSRELQAERMGPLAGGLPF
jgi:nucleoid-associated protein EbfC